MALAEGPTKYLSAKGGVSSANNIGIDDFGTVTHNYTRNTSWHSDTGLFAGDIKTETGFFTAVAAGLDFGVYRLEAELGYHRSNLGDSSLTSSYGNDVSSKMPNVSGFYAAGPYDAEGSVSVASFMVNGLYDIDLNDLPFINTTLAITPYVGLGLGVANVDYDSPGMIDDSATTFAYQLMAGVGYDITPNWNVGVEYRYFGTASHTVNMRGDVSSEYYPSAFVNTTVENSYQSHDISVGVRYSF